MTSHFLRICVLASICVASLAGTSVARDAFDGSWSVLIQTQSGACDVTFRSGVQIRNGVIFSEAGGFNMNGHVSQKGIVRVSVSAGGQSASGSGRLSHNSGGGVWRGQGNRGRCSGTWAAERRG